MKSTDYIMCFSNKAVRKLTCQMKEKLDNKHQTVEAVCQIFVNLLYYIYSVHISSLGFISTHASVCKLFILLNRFSKLCKMPVLF